VNRAFILTTDAILAMIVSALIMTSALALVSRFEAPLENARPLEDLSADFLAMLEKDGTLEDAAVSGGNGGLIAALGELPPSVCGHLQLYENGTVVMQANRTGCACDTDLVVMHRAFVAREDSTEREMYAHFGGCYT